MIDNSVVVVCIKVTSVIYLLSLSIKVSQLLLGGKIAS